MYQKSPYKEESFISLCGFIEVGKTKNAIFYYQYNKMTFEKIKRFLQNIAARYTHGYNKNKDLTNCLSKTPW